MTTKVMLVLEKDKSTVVTIYIERRGFVDNRNCGYLSEYRKALNEEK